jgi:hypothetical protein
MKRYTHVGCIVLRLISSLLAAQLNQLSQTLFKASQGLKECGEPMTGGTSATMARCLPLWLGLRFLGHDGLAARIEHCIVLVRKYVHILLSRLRILCFCFHV